MTSTSRLSQLLLPKNPTIDYSSLRTSSMSQKSTQKSVMNLRSFGSRFTPNQSTINHNYVKSPLMRNRLSMSGHRLGQDLHTSKTNEKICLTEFESIFIKNGQSKEIGTDLINCRAILLNVHNQENNDIIGKLLIHYDGDNNIIDLPKSLQHMSYKDCVASEISKYLCKDQNIKYSLQSIVPGLINHDSRYRNLDELAKKMLETLQFGLADEYDSKIIIDSPDPNERPVLLTAVTFTIDADKDIDVSIDIKFISKFDHKARVENKLSYNEGDYESYFDENKKIIDNSFQR